jgi:hypothetical protein
MKSKLLLSLLLSFVVMSTLALYAQSIPDDSLYLSQTPPANIPKEFAPGRLVTTGTYAGERIYFSSDNKEIFYTEMTNGWGLKNTVSKIKCFKYVNNKWNGPILLFEHYYDPSLSVDNDTLFFQKDGDGTTVSYSIRNDTGWSAPLTYIKRNSQIYLLQFTNNGNKYISDAGAAGNIAGGYNVSRVMSNNTDVSLGKPVNLAGDLEDYFIAGDESFMVLGGANEFQSSLRDLGVSYRKADNTWTNPKSLGPAVNSLGGNLWAPYVTADNKYLFYSRGTNPQTTKIYWVRIDGLLDSLRHTSFPPYTKWPIAWQKGAVGVLFNFTVLDSTFYDDDPVSLTYSATLGDGSPLPSWLSFDSVTRTFSGTPLTVISMIHPLSIKVIAANTNHESCSCIFNLSIANPTGIEKNKNQIPKESQLLQNYPNPFNPSTTINYYLANPSFVRLTIYNILGQKIRALQNAFQTAGEYSLMWNGMDDSNTPVSSGVYFYRLQTDNLNIQKKMIYEK